MAGPVAAPRAAGAPSGAAPTERVLFAPARASTLVAANKPHAQLHDGFYLRLGLGVTQASGAIVTPATTTSAEGVVSSTGAPAHATLTGPGAAFDVAVGATVYRGLVLAFDASARLLGDAAIHPEKGKGRTPLPKVTFGKSLTLVHLGAMADWYTDPKKGLHVQGGIGIARVSHTVVRPSGATGQDQAATYTGLGLHLGLGYDTFISDEWSLGGLLRIDTASVTADATKGFSDRTGPPDTSISIFAPSLFFTGTYN